MAKKKFHVGDKVTLTKRVPDYLKEESRTRRSRTIIRIEYNKYLQANEYYLGTNRTDPSWEISGYPFRSYQLSKFKGESKAGRPRIHKRYSTRKSRLSSLKLGRF